MNLSEYLSTEVTKGTEKSFIFSAFREQYFGANVFST
jgi:hypothetical protein